MQVGTLTGVSPLDREDLLAPSTAATIKLIGFSPEELSVVEIDPTLSDTGAFCEHYGVLPEQAANCVVVEGKRDGVQRYAACVILATTKADVNKLVKRQLDVNKISFAPMERAVELTGMEYGGITPVGLPPDRPILVDARVAASPVLIIGSGVRKSKLIISGTALAKLPNAVVLAGLGIDRQPQ